MTVKDIYNKVLVVFRSSRGHNFIVFSVFLVIATFLWWVTALNDEGQSDVRMPVRITNVPDSVTIVSNVPATVTAGVRARGSQLIKYSWSKTPVFNIDFRLYRDGNYLKLSDTDIKSIARQTLGVGSVVVVSPDSLNLAFTSQPPVVLPVTLDYSATPGPQVTLVGKPVVSPDSVKVYTLPHHSVDVASITTEPVKFSSINESVTRRVRLITPPNSRIIPDSIEVTVNVESLIFKTRRVAIEPVNVPAGHRLITFPSQVEVMYMIPVSDYVDSEPRIRVVADYNSISPVSGKVRLRVAEASDMLQNVHLASDSIEYIIERL